MYHIKPLGMIKTYGFPKTLMGMISFYTRKDYMNIYGIGVA